MDNFNAREALRGAEIRTFDLLAAVLTPERWAKFLNALLNVAAADGNRGLARKLLGAGAAVGNALHEAARGGHEEIANDLLEHGAAIDDKGVYGWTPLHCAAGAGKTKVVQLLLLKGADKDALDPEECTPLFVAVVRGQVGTALALLAAGANGSLRCDEWKMTMLHAAARSDHVDVMRVVIESGAEVDAVDRDEGTPLHYASRKNKAGAIDVLVDAEANIKARDDAGNTPLHEAAGHPGLEASLALLKHGAHVNAQNSNNQETPLHWAITAAGKPGAAEVVDLLLRSGADETILNVDGKTAADIVGDGVDEEDQWAEDVDRVRQPLANAPADRAWRRRGYLVLCRAHPDRVQPVQDITSAHTGVARNTRSCRTLARTETGGCTGTAEGSMADERTGADRAYLLSRVLELQEEGIFRTIVGYL